MAFRDDLCGDKVFVSSDSSLDLGLTDTFSSPLSLPLSTSLLSFPKPPSLATVKAEASSLTDQGNSFSDPDDDTQMSSVSSSATSFSSQPKKNKRAYSAKGHSSDPDYTPDPDSDSSDSDDFSDTDQKAPINYKKRKDTSTDPKMDSSYENDDSSDTDQKAPLKFTEHSYNSTDRSTEIFCTDFPPIKNLKAFIFNIDAEIKKVKDSNPKHLDIIFDVAKNLIAFFAAVKKDRDAKVKGLDSRKGEKQNPLQQLSEHKIQAPLSLQLFSELETFYRTPKKYFTSHTATCIKNIIFTLSSVLSRHQTRSLMSELSNINITTYTYNGKKIFRARLSGKGYILESLELIASNPKQKSAKPQKSAAKIDESSHPRPSKKRRKDSDSTSLPADAKMTTASLMQRFQGLSPTPSQSPVASPAQALQNPSLSASSASGEIETNKVTKLAMDVGNDDAHTLSSSFSQTPALTLTPTSR